jgi:hypothetical protein
MRFGNQSRVFTVTLGYYDDGRVGEVFIDGAQSGSEMEGVTRDGAVLISLGLQHGVPLETMKHATSRDRNNDATTIIGAVVDRILEYENENSGQARS